MSVKVVGGVHASKRRARPIPTNGKSTKKPRALPGHPAAPVEEDPGPNAGISISMAGVADEDDNYWRDIYQQLLRSSAALFGKDIMGVEIGPHMEEWSELMNQHSRIATEAARDHSKTTMFSYVYPVWRAWSEPGVEVYLFSKTLEQAQEFLDIIMWGRNNLRGIADIPELKHLVPETDQVRDTRSRARLNRSDVVLTNGSRIRAVGYGKAIRGRHPKYVVLDDPLNDEDMWSETVRRKNIAYFQSAIANMVMPSNQHDGHFDGGQCIVVGCVTEDTWVPTEKGLRKIGDLRPGCRKPQTLSDLSLGVEGREGLREATKFWDNGKCPTKKIELSSGTVLEGSYKHPVLTMPESGIPEWTKMSVLEKGDWVAIKIGTEAWGKAPEGLDQDTAYLMGLWCAEGSHEAPYRLTIASIDDEIHTFLKARSEKWCSHRGGTHWRCSNKALLTQWGIWGVKWCTAIDKRIPNSIMSGSRENAIAWLQGYLDGDGNVYVKGSAVQVAVGSISEALIDDLKILLLNLGIPSSKFSKPYRPTERAPYGHLLYVLRMLGDPARKLVGFGFRLTRKKQDLALLGTGFSVPNQAQLIRAAMNSKPRRPSVAGTEWTPPPFNVAEILKSTAAKSTTLLRVVAWYKKYGADPVVCDQISQNAFGNFRWEQVRLIEDSESYTVDFVVSNGHSFISNGIVSHNTPYHLADLYGWLEENEVYEFRRYPGIIQEDGKERALFPWRWSLKQLHGKKKEIGAIAFSREIMCIPINDDISIFPTYLFPPLFDKTLKLRPTKEEIKQRQLDVFIGIDIARSASVGADYFVIFIIGKDPQGCRYILDIQRTKGLPFKRQLELIAIAAERYDPTLIYIESNALQQLYTDEMRRMSDLPVKEFVTLAVNKYPLDKGVPGLRIVLENQKVIIPRGDEYSRTTTNIWMTEASQFGYVEGKLMGIGTHDDTVMAWWFAEEAAKAGGFSFAFDEEGGSEVFDTDEKESDEDYEDVLIGPAEEREEGSNISLF